MFRFQSSLRSESSSSLSEKGISSSSYTYSIRSSISSTDDTEDSLIDDKPFINTVDIKSCSRQDRLLPCESVQKRARRQIRRLCCFKKSPKLIVETTPDIAFSYAIRPLPSSTLHNNSTTTTNRRNNAATEDRTALIITYTTSTPSPQIQRTLESALHHFPPSNIFVIGNGGSQVPINNTSRICSWFGVRHIWIPTSSRVAAQYVGILAAKGFRFCLLIDEDVILPRDFCVESDRIGTHEFWGQAPVKGIGYSIAKEEGEGEGDDDDDEDEVDEGQSLQFFSLPALPATFFDNRSTNAGTAAFPHGRISLWDREFLEECFRRHPGYARSGNWFLGFNLRVVLGR